MSLSKPIGGFFDLELPVKGAVIWSDALLLNSGRSCLNYILETTHIKKIYIPIYTCSAVIDTVLSSGLEYQFYSIDSNFEIINLPTLNDNEYLLYTNYFGLKDAYCRSIAEIFNDRLILDNSQALFMKRPLRASTFYSPRKFIGIPDGGMVYTEGRVSHKIDRSESYHRAIHLLKRVDTGPENSYNDFQKSEKELSLEGMKKMSHLTKRILESVDYTNVKQRRLKNFQYLQSVLDRSNELTLNLNDVACPLVYPYLIKNGGVIRQKLVKHKLYTPLYWPNVIESMSEGGLEFELAMNTIPIPIDQRYDESDMKEVVRILNECNN